MEDPDVDLPKVIDIENPEWLYFGRYSTFYVVARKDGSESVSSGRLIKLEDLSHTVPSLTPPYIEDAEDGVVNIMDVADGVDVKISYPDAVAGDIVTFVWKPVATNGLPVNGASYVNSWVWDESLFALYFTIPYDVFYPEGQGFNGVVDAFYFVQKVNSVSGVMPVSDVVHCKIGTI